MAARRPAPYFGASRFRGLERQGSRQWGMYVRMFDILVGKTVLLQDSSEVKFGV